MKATLNIKYSFSEEYTNPRRCGRFELIDGYPAPYLLSINAHITDVHRVNYALLMCEISIILRAHEIETVAVSNQGGDIEFRFLNETDALLAKLLLSGELSFDA
jgi:hypothetical protein